MPQRYQARIALGQQPMMRKIVIVFFLLINGL
jgi:hypothetical protein